MQCCLCLQVLSSVVSFANTMLSCRGDGVTPGRRDNRSRRMQHSVSKRDNSSPGVCYDAPAWINRANAALWGS